MPYPAAAPIAKKVIPYKWNACLGVTLGILQASCKTVGTQGATKAGASAASAITPGIALVYTGMADEQTQVILFDAGVKANIYDVAKDLATVANTGGIESRSPLDCASLESKVTKDPKIPAGVQCYVEFVGTGRVGSTKNGVALLLYPLENGDGMRSWQPATAALRPSGNMRVPADGPPVKGNSSMDTDAVFAGMKAIREKFPRTGSDGRDCLKNPKTALWTDIQAHYYCQLPYTIRYCFSSKLAEARDPAKALSYCSEADNASDWQANHDPMFAAYGPGGADWRWLLDEQKDLFVYVMFNRLGTNDFNIEQQNSVINRFYKDVANYPTRPRRAVDPYPAWLPEQPRYDALRQAQTASTR